MTPLTGTPGVEDVVVVATRLTLAEGAAVVTSWVDYYYGASA